MYASLDPCIHPHYSRYVLLIWLRLSVGCILQAPQISTGPWPTWAPSRHAWLPRGTVVSSTLAGVVSVSLDFDHHVRAPRVRPVLTKCSGPWPGRPVPPALNRSSRGVRQFCRQQDQLDCLTSSAGSVWVRGRCQISPAAVRLTRQGEHCRACRAAPVNTASTGQIVFYWTLPVLGRAGIPCR
jgi:hypothetical protein